MRWSSAFIRWRHSLGAKITMKWLTKILKLIGGLLLFVVSVVIGMMMVMLWDANQLERELQQLAASLKLTGSAFVIPLPANRIIMLTARNTDSDLTCASIRIKQGVVRSAQIGDKKPSLVFQDGIDLTHAAETLIPCNQWRIALMANWSFLKGEITINYAGAAITEIGVPLIWD